MSVGSCDGLEDPSVATRHLIPAGRSGGTTALIVNPQRNIKPLQDDPHSTMILACDKDLCGQSGVPKLPVFFTLENTGPLNNEAARRAQRRAYLTRG